MRVIFIGAGSVLLLVLTLLGIRQWALLVPIAPFDHPFLKGHLAPHYAVRVKTDAEAREARALQKDIIYFLDLKFTSDGKFLLLQPEEVTGALTRDSLGDEKWKGNQLSRYSEAEIRFIFPNAERLQDFLTAFPRQRAILNINDNVEGVHTKLIEALQDFHPGERFLFQSDVELILKSLKEQNPLWLFGSSRSDLMKILTFDSIGLEAASPFHGDVYLSPFKLLGRDSFTKGVLAEMKRRQKDIFLGPLSDEAEFAEAQKRGASGFIFNDVTLLRKALSKQH